jgi:uncharacterized protein YjbI with pentapeptide repeats
MKRPAVRIKIAGAALGVAMFLASSAVAGCDDPAAAGVDWSGCNMQGQFLEGVDLQGATLRNTDFRGAILDGANLTGADLTGAMFAYAPLSAEMTTICIYSDLDECLQYDASLSGTIWTDGRICTSFFQGRCQ